MSSGGLSATRLRRMHDVLAGHVERGEPSGLISLVERRGELHVDCIGCERDAIFRIASPAMPRADSTGTHLAHRYRTCPDCARVLACAGSC